MSISGNASTEQDNTAVACYSMMQKMYSKEYSEFIQLFYGIRVKRVVQNDSCI